MVDQLRTFAAEVTRVAKEVGTEGKLGGQADVKGVVRHLEGPDRQRQPAGRQPDRPGAQHRAGDDRGRQRRPVAEDHRRRQGRDPRAEEHHQHDGRSAAHVRRRGDPRRRARSAPRASWAARRRCPGVTGTWKDLTDNVNVMAVEPDRPGARHRQGRDRGRQRRPVAEVRGRGQGRDRRARRHHQRHDRHAAHRSPTRSPRWRARSAPRASWAARPRCPGAAGTWRDLTDNVNMLAGNLTNQVRNIAAVTTAVANGDLSQKITVDAKGEILELKNTINTMVDQLRTFAARGDPRRARGRHRGQAGRPGRGARRRRHLAGPHRQRERDGRRT